MGTLAVSLPDTFWIRSQTSGVRGPGRPQGSPLLHPTAPALTMNGGEAVRVVMVGAGEERKWGGDPCGRPRTSKVSGKEALAVAMFSRAPVAIRVASACVTITTLTFLEL